MTVVRRRPAMATWFEFRLDGADPDHIGAVAEAMLDEVERLGRLLSRFDPAGEVARVNRDAATRPVRLDPEVFAVLADALARREMTDGYFDVVAPRGAAAELVRLDHVHRTVRFLEEGPMIDLGGYGKGYAPRRLGPAPGRVRGGRRLAPRRDELGPGPRPARGGCGVGRRPGRPGRRRHRGRPRLPGRRRGAVDLGRVRPGLRLDRPGRPANRRPLVEPASCSVVAPTATDAEVLSTALLVMGKGRAVEYLETRGPSLPAPCRVAWVDRAGLAWLRPGGRP